MKEKGVKGAVDETLLAERIVSVNLCLMLNEQSDQATEPFDVKHSWFAKVPPAHQFRIIETKARKFPEVGKEKRDQSLTSRIFRSFVLQKLTNGSCTNFTTIPTFM